MQAEVLNKLFALNHSLGATQYLGGTGELLNICSDKILSRLQYYIAGEEAFIPIL